MPINEAFLDELETEARSTRKILERIPLDKSDWAPHKKSMPIGRLATHVAELTGWVTVTIGKDELDFAKFDYKPKIAESTEELIAIFEDNLSKSEKCLRESGDEVFSQDWTMRNGEHIFFTLPKIKVLRTFCFNHLVHHRAQLSVYLRLLDIPVPGIYGPTADEQM